MTRGPRGRAGQRRHKVASGPASRVLALTEAVGGWYTIELFVDPPRRPNLRLLQGGKAE